MPDNNPDTTSNGDMRAIGPVAHSACKISPYATDLTVKMTCSITQDDELVKQFYDPSKPAKFTAEVYLDGNLRYHLCGQLCLCVHVECVGPKDPTEQPWCERVKMDPCGDGYYTINVDIPKDQLQAGECGSVCCFVATLTSFTYECPPEYPDGMPGHIACYCKGPCVMVYHPPEHNNGHNNSTGGHMD